MSGMLTLQQASQWLQDSGWWGTARPCCSACTPTPAASSRATCLSARVARALARRAKKHIHSSGVPDSLTSANHGQRHHILIGRKGFGGAVRARVVIYDDLILAGILLEHLADAPQENANGWGFVVRRNADIEHGSSGDGQP